MGFQNESYFTSIVDDDESARTAIQGVLKSVGLQARSFRSAGEFLESGQVRETACLISDVRMPGMSGLELQARLVEEHWRIPIIFVTAHGDSRMQAQAMKAGAMAFLGKPFDDEVLLQELRTALEIDLAGRRRNGCRCGLSGSENMR